MDIKAIVQRKDVQIGAASAVSLGVGIAIGYLAGNKIAMKKCEKILEEEYAAWNASRPITITNNYQDKPPLGDLAELAEDSTLDPEKMRVVGLSLDDKPNAFGGTIEEVREGKASLSSVVSTLGYSDGSDHETEDEDEEVHSRESTRQNVFAQNEGPNPQPDDVHETELEDFDFDRQADLRDEGKPYVVTQEQYLENPDDYSNLTFTFYEDGGDLVDDSNGIIPNFEAIIGEDNLLFGKGSRDNNIVFIRNDEKRLDIEILRSYGSYTSDVLGFKHSDEDRKPGVRKFKNFD